MTNYLDALDEQQATAAFVRARSLLREDAHVTVDEVLSLENTLRPLVALAEVHQTVVPLLDRAELWGLAMMWDTAAVDRSPDELQARAERWLRLAAPELALLTIAELSSTGADVTELKQRAVAALDQARQVRDGMFHENLAALEPRDQALAEALARCPRSWIPLLPMGAGIASHGNHGGPLIQLWAASPDTAVREAQRLLDGLDAAPSCIIAGVGDGALPVLASRLLTADGAWLGTGPVHVVEVLLPRLRALFEMEDLSAALAQGRLCFHWGTGAVESLRAALRDAASTWHEHVIGGDPNAVTVIRRVYEILAQAA